jgi:DNA-binding protein WhiA
MSFSMDVKTELLSKPDENDCCALSELSAIVHTAGSISISREGLYTEINSENEGLIKKICLLFKRLFNITAEVFSEKKISLKKHTLYTLSTPKNGSEQLLNDLGIINYDENNHRQINSGIDGYITEQECCAASYLKGAFLSCGSITVPPCGEDKKGMGYHMEFVLSGAEMSQGIASLLGRFIIATKIAQRNDSFVVYIKEKEGISDFLALMKASKSVLNLQNIIVEREVKNNTNRQTNCIVANIDKAVGAAMEQIEAIKHIEASDGLNSLPQKLRETAKLRLENPDISLEAIAALAGITKSGIYHRMKRIMKISKEK